MEIKRTGSVSVKFGDSIGADDLKQFAAAIPTGAMVKVVQSRGDQRDPAMTTMTATWDLGPATKPFPYDGGFIPTPGMGDTILYGHSDGIAE